MAGDPTLETITQARSMVLCAALFAGASSARAQSTEIVSVDSARSMGNGHSYTPAISADGRFVLFTSVATNLVGVDANGLEDVFLRDRLLGTTELVSIGAGGVQGNGPSSTGSISADGRFAAFSSLASNLAPGDTNGVFDVLLRDRLLGTTELVSVDSAGVPGSGGSAGPVLSPNGRFVAFTSSATNLVAGDTNALDDVFLRDRLLGTTERASLGPAGSQGSGGSYYGVPSADGRFVAFYSDAANLVAGDTNGAQDVFVRDRLLATTERVSVNSSAAQGNGASAVPSLSADGRYVSFESWATNMAAADTNGTADIFVRDRLLGTTEVASLDSAGQSGNGQCRWAALTSDGRQVVFASRATNLVAGDSNNGWDGFVRDLQGGVTLRVTVDSSGLEANGESFYATISGDGRCVAFYSIASNLVAGDTGGFEDVFVRDRDGGPVRFCSPGLAGVISCPCANPSAGPGRGCDNSSGTGGARIDGQGASSLSGDTLVFTTVAERATATSIVLSGTGVAVTGIAFGQGVRCVAGLLKRLYVKTASGGSITAPVPGDLSVSARSASLGDAIQAGSHRYYVVYYRDPIVLGSCPATSTFNATDALDATWTP